ncbi:MAG: glycerol-3-phosphate dehydrogenase/oxidase [Gammaproteobacteria bacterium]|nr:glycerol-3-phosphate dehydrogenase/oxidase [Gammaproteobacteria bacterium]
MQQDYDVVVIGAGIHGAGVAQAVAAAGYSVLVLEQYDGAAKGSSSRSSKLIHGGLRYLESGQLHLVRECLHERAVLLRIAPHLVKLVPFHIPVYRDTRRRPWKIILGLIIYTLFSRKRFHMVSRRTWNQLDGLRTDRLDAVLSYYDAQTDDAHLTRSVLASARELGADVMTCAEFTRARLGPDEVEVSYVRNADRQTISARVLINAAGPWVNLVLASVYRSSGQEVDKLDAELVQGSHIVVPGDLSHPYYLEAPQDGRAVFVVPWKNNILVGTTESHYQGDPASVKPLSAEIEYLLEVYNHYFRQDLGREQVIDAFAGLRVLPGGQGEAFNKSRDTHFLADDASHPRLVSIYGGKLTSYRAVADKLLAMISKTLPVRTPLADTRTLKLPLID